MEQLKYIPKQFEGLYLKQLKELKEKMYSVSGWKTQIVRPREIVYHIAPSDMQRWEEMQQRWEHAGLYAIKLFARMGAREE